jgi:hypothetical protein
MNKYTCKNEKITKSQQRNRRCKEELNGNFRPEKSFKPSWVGSRTM